MSTREQQTMISDEARLRRLRFRAWHRGTKESDILLGSFVDSRLDQFSEADIVWMETLLAEQDVDILQWAMSISPCPARFEGPMMNAIRRLDYLPAVS
jgi:antitoxin CptB